MNMSQFELQLSLGSRHLSTRTYLVCSSSQLFFSLDLLQPQNCWTAAIERPSIHCKSPTIKSDGEVCQHNNGFVERFVHFCVWWYRQQRLSIYYQKQAASCDLCQISAKSAHFHATFNGSMSKQFLSLTTLKLSTYLLPNSEFSINSSLFSLDFKLENCAV